MSDDLKQSSNQSLNPEAEANGSDSVVSEDLPVAPEVVATTNKNSALAASGLFEGEDNVVDFADLKEEMEYDEEEQRNFTNLYESTMSDFAEGEVVTGKVLAISDKDVAIDIGFKSEGIVSLEEFSSPDELEVGQDVEVFLDTVENKDGQLVLSRKKAEFMEAWARVVTSFENEEVLSGRCMRRIKGGIVVDLQGVDAFLPGSQIDVRPIRDFDAFIGHDMDFRIVKVNESRKNIVVSHRILVEAELVEHRKAILDNLEKEQILEGIVKNITDFGVFIDLGGVDGLLHINDLSWGRVNHPSEIVSLDEKVKIMVLDFNEAKDRISLGYKQLQPHPWIDVDKKYPVDSIITGKVVSISDYGAFVELEKGVEGLIHISEMSWTQHIRHPSKLVSVGETVEAKVLNLDAEGRKISLGLKQLEPDPWDQIGDKFPVGSQQNGVVRNLTAFGAFVELEEGIDGLVHISDLSWTKKIRHPGEVLKKGDEVDVVVLNLDKDNRRISLGYKQTKDNPWDQFIDSYSVGKATNGKIVRMIDKGVIVELPEEVDGFVPMSHLVKENLSKPSEGYTVGDALDLLVIEFNKEHKKIILSEKAAAREMAAEVTEDSADDEAAEAEGATNEPDAAEAEASAEAADAEPDASEEAEASAPEEEAQAETEAPEESGADDEASDAPETAAAQADEDGAEKEAASDAEGDGTDADSETSEEALSDDAPAEEADKSEVDENEEEKADKKD